VIPKAFSLYSLGHRQCIAPDIRLALKKWPQSAPSFAIYVLMREPGRKSIMLGIFFVG
jgi:hypothetical protein